jgi:hypothetical protein
VFRKTQRIAPKDPIGRYYTRMCHCMRKRPEWTARIFTEMLEEGGLPERIEDGCKKFLREYLKKMNKKE